MVVWCLVFRVAWKSVGNSNWIVALEQWKKQPCPSRSNLGSSWTGFILLLQARNSIAISNTFQAVTKHSKKRSVLTKLEFNFGFWWLFDVSLSALPRKVVEIALELSHWSNEKNVSMTIQFGIAMDTVICFIAPGPQFHCYVQYFSSRLKSTLRKDRFWQSWNLSLDFGGCLMSLFPRCLEKLWK